jgi:tetratricopeptide (TPR) repeat protein
VAQDFASLQIESPAQLSTLLLADTEAVRAWLEDAPPPNTDDHNWLERRMPQELNLRHRESLEKRILEQFAPTRMRTLERVLPGFPEEEVLRTTVQPRHAVQTGAAPALTRGLLAHYRSLGRDDRVRQIRAWVREFERGGSRRLQRAHYEQRLEAARAAQRSGDREAAAQIYRELLELPGQSAYLEAGVAVADFLADTGRPEEALTLARRMQRQFPAHPRPYTIGIRALVELGRRDEACALHSRAALLGALPAANATRLCAEP